jgi:hypothetical protein
MGFRLPKITVHLGHRVRGLTAFPLFTEPEGSIDYVLGTEAIAEGTLVVSEVGLRMDVGRVRVKNRSDRPALLFEGDQIVGARQDRIVNTTVLVPAKKQIDVFVSCCEHGRSSGRTSRFSAGDHPAPICLRQVVKGSVTQALMGGRGFTADQSGIWGHIRSHQSDRNAPSPTQALADLYTNETECLQDYDGALPYPPRATGVAFAIGGRVVSLDLFDRPSTCGARWPRLVASGAVDAERAGFVVGTAGIDDVKSHVDAAVQAPWQATSGVGLGDEMRASAPGVEASALVVDGRIVHFSAVEGRTRHGHATR